MHTDNTTTPPNTNPYNMICEGMEVSELEAALLFFLRTGKREEPPTDPEERQQWQEAKSALDARLREWIS